MNRRSFFSRLHLWAIIPNALAWVLLWNDWSVGNVVNGIIVATVVTALLPLPVVHLGARVRWLRLGGFLLRFLRDLTVASFLIAWQAIRPRSQDDSSIIGVRLRSDSELIMAIVAEMVSLSPGSLAIEIEPSTRTIYSHVLSADTDADVAKFRHDVLDLEARLIRAIGSPSDRALLDQPLQAGGHS
jgi:multicomponent Na+:H+ antiporter subunit E